MVFASVHRTVALHHPRGGFVILISKHGHLIKWIIQFYWLEDVKVQHTIQYTSFIISRWSTIKCYTQKIIILWVSPTKLQNCETNRLKACMLSETQTERLLTWVIGRREKVLCKPGLCCGLTSDCSGFTPPSLLPIFARRPLFQTHQGPAYIMLH